MPRKPLVNHLIVKRLCALWSPWSALDIEECTDTKWVKFFLMDLHPQTEFRDFDQRSVLYHLRRINYFVRQLQAGVALDPIVVDNMCYGSRVYPTPVVDDGNHRLIAYILTDTAKVPAHYGGRVDLLRYLEGKKKSFPGDPV